MNGRYFFKLIKDREALLNPAGPCGKGFSKQEIADILSGDIFNKLNLTKKAEVTTVEKGTEVKLERPKTLPETCLAVLCEFFEKEKTINEAFIASVQMKGEGKPHLMIMLNDTSKNEELFRRSSELVTKWLDIQDTYVDFLFDSGDNFSQQFKRSAVRFYKKKLFGII